MKKVLKKGGALLFTTVVLIAISLIAAGLSMYLIGSTRIANRSNAYNELKIEFTNKFYDNYSSLITNEVFTSDEEIQIALQDEVTSIEVNALFTYNRDLFHTSFIKIDTYEYVVTIEKQVDTHTYLYERIISYKDLSFSIVSKGVFGIHDIL